MVEWAATVLSGGYNQRLKIKKEKMKKISAMEWLENYPQKLNNNNSGGNFIVL